MTKTPPGIKIISDIPGTGPELKKGDRIRIRYDIQLNHGDFVARDVELVLIVGDRNVVAGFRYGLEGMRSGGARKFRASPHLCYRDEEVGCCYPDTEVRTIPKNAVLIFDVKSVELVTE